MLFANYCASAMFGSKQQKHITVVHTLFVDGVGLPMTHHNNHGWTPEMWHTFLRRLHHLQKLNLRTGALFFWPGPEWRICLSFL